MTAFRIALPLVPSLNNAYATNKRTGRRFVVKKVRDWKEDAGWQILIAKPPRITGPYELTLYLPEKTRGDISNRIKIVEDLLVEHGLTPDDREAAGVSVFRTPLAEPGSCVVMVESVALTAPNGRENS